MVHPVPAPVSTNAELNSSSKLTGNSQKLILFSRGNAISGAPIITGTKIFPNPPIRAGITIKKSGLGLDSLRFPPAPKPYVTISRHTAFPCTRCTYLPTPLSVLALTFQIHSMSYYVAAYDDLYIEVFVFGLWPPSGD